MFGGMLEYIGMFQTIVFKTVTGFYRSWHRTLFSALDCGGAVERLLADGGAPTCENKGL